jgi:hypothetical protein
MPRLWRRFRPLLGPVLGLCLVATGGRAGEFVGIPAREFAAHYRVQERSQWCWASCVEMALAHAGVPVTQERIVRRVMGRDVDLGALPGELVAAATGVFQRPDGATVRLEGRYLAGTPPAEVLHDHLGGGEPAILLCTRPDGRGHAVVLGGLEVARDQDGGLAIAALHVYDPEAPAASATPPGNDRHPDPRARRLATRAGDGGLATTLGTIDGVVLVRGARPAQQERDGLRPGATADRTMTDTGEVVGDDKIRSDRSGAGKAKARPNAHEKDRKGRH